MKTSNLVLGASVGGKFNLYMEDELICEVTIVDSITDGSHGRIAFKAPRSVTILREKVALRGTSDANANGR